MGRVGSGSGRKEGLRRGASATEWLGGVGGGQPGVWIRACPASATPHPLCPSSQPAT